MGADISDPRIIASPAGHLIMDSSAIPAGGNFVRLPDDAHRALTAAPAYAPAPDLCCITAYYNPNGAVNRRQNYEQFRLRFLESGQQLLTIECATGTMPFELPASPNVIRVRSRDTLWQKERLLNVALEQVIGRWPKVAWLDGDILFENADWICDVSRLLDDRPIAQPFERAVWLPPGVTCADGTPINPDSHADISTLLGYSAVLLTQKKLVGHVGYAWAARTDLLAASGLYDACVVGGADFLMASAAAGVQRAVGAERSLTPAHYAHYLRWADPFSSRIGGKLGYVPGNVLHLWHGSMADRQYDQRGQCLIQAGYDPARHLVMNKDKCWEWAADSGRLAAQVQRYFAARKEDST